MSKSILISIKPRFVAKILNGEKTIEIRKTMPKCELPIDVYIYCTKEKHQELCWFDEFGYKQTMVNHIHNLPTYNGKVVAKFTLKCVVPCKLILDRIYDKIFIPQYQLTHKELEKYVGNKDFYEWHISNLVIFDRPKELSEFKQEKKVECYNADFDYHTIEYRKYQLTKAPQSWCYVEKEK